MPISSQRTGAVYAPHLDEIADILALGLVRLWAPKSSGISADSGESSLHISPDQSGGVVPDVAEETP